MPGFDGTGPMGMGPMTGGSRGYCYPGVARGGGLPYGTWRWARYGYPTPQYGKSFVNRKQEMDFLNSEAQELKKSLEEINARIQELCDEGE